MQKTAPLPLLLALGALLALVSVTMAGSGAGAQRSSPEPRPGDGATSMADQAGPDVRGRLTHGLGPLRLVDVRRLPEATAAPAAVSPPAPRRPPSAPSDVPPPPAGLPLGPAAGPQPKAPSTVTSFPGLDDTNNPFPLQPPDPQVAAGPNHVFQMTNITGRIFTKAGAAVQTFPLRSFFGIPASWGEADPKIIYDGLSGRWFASYFSYDGLSETRVYLAVSASSDPTATWCVGYASWILPLGVPLADYPGIGVTSDKFTVSANIFEGIFRSFLGEQTLVMQKSDWLSCSSPIGGVFLTSRGGTWGTTRPAHSLSAVGDQYLAEFDWTFASRLCIDRITGTPDAGNVNRTTTCRTVAAQNSPPDAAQAGGADLIATNDNRVLEVIYRNGTLWVAANGSCNLAAGTRSCLRLTAVSVPAVTIIEDNLWGHADYYLFYPSIRVDESGDLYVVFALSGPGAFATAAVSGRLSTEPANTLQPWQVLKAGEVYYNPSPATTERWGDYFGAGLDPSFPDCVWVVGEYAKNTAGLDWGTYIGALTFSNACPGSPPPTDTDSDGFADSLETFMGTDPFDGCAADTIRNNEDPDPWPPDGDDDQDVDTGDLIRLFGDPDGDGVPIILVPANYTRRSDFSADGDVDVGDVIAGLRAHMLTSCNP